jgi:hypothetical protein
MRMNFMVAVISALSLTSVAHATFQSESFLPENNLWMLDDPAGPSNITEQQFNDIVKQVTGVYEPVFKSFGGTMRVSAKWTDSQVNAYARQLGSLWMLNFFGGLARRPEISPDGFALVICHETGHHLGGFPFVESWAANEGEADYFATLVCGKKLWANDKAENAKAAATVSLPAKQACDTSYPGQDERNLCYRIANASQTLGNLLAALGQEAVPAYDTPDKTVVTVTDNQHPAGQCRLDTYLAGAICTAKWDEKLIPGRNHPDGQASAGAERQAGEHSCMRASGYEFGIRPACWFKPGI